MYIIQEFRDRVSSALSRLFGVSAAVVPSLHTPARLPVAADQPVNHVAAQFITVVPQVPPTLSVSQGPTARPRRHPSPSQALTYTIVFITSEVFLILNSEARTNEKSVVPRTTRKKYPV